MTLRAFVFAALVIFPAWFSSAGLPEPKADVVVTAPGVAVSFQPLVNDTDPDDDALTISSFSQTNNATVEEISPGVLRYTPKDGFFGHDEVSYTVSDGSTSTTSVAHLYVTTTGKSWPLAASKLYQNYGAVGNLYPQDIVFSSVGPDGKPLMVESFSQPASGRLELIKQNVVRYYPSGTQPWTFTYRQSDGESISNTATIEVTGPRGTGTYTYAMRDEVVTRPGRSVDVPVLRNDLRATAISTFSQPAHGLVTQPEPGILRYTPEPGFEGPDEFTYSATGVGSVVPTATVSINVTSREKPDVADDSITVGSGGFMDIRVLENDHEVVGGALSIAQFSQPQHGVVTQPAPGRLRYTAAAGFVGTDTFIYQATNGKGVASGTVTVRVLGRRAPYARDDTRETASVMPIVIPVLLNDSAFNGALLVPKISAAPANGTAIFENGVVTYTPANGFSGEDTFGYSVSDGELTSFATVRVRVKNLPPVVSDKAITVTSGHWKSFDPIDQGYDPEGVLLKVGKISQPSHGFVDRGAFLAYISNRGYVGEDSFTCEILDGVANFPVTVRVTVVPNSPPVAVDDRLYVPVGTTTSIRVPFDQNDYDPEGYYISVASWIAPQHGIAEMVQGTFRYTPGPDYAGFDQFKYTLKDTSGDTSEATVTVSAETNAPPVPVNDVAKVPAGVDSVRIAVLANDTDPDADTLTVSGFTTPARGTIRRAGSDLTYETYSRTSATSDSFTYEVTDGHGNVRSATVTVDVSEAIPVGEAPPIYPDFAVLPAGASTLRIYVEKNDEASNYSSITSVTNGTQGTATIGRSSDSEYVDYVPNSGFAGEDRFTYTIVDDRGRTRSTFVRVVAGPKRPPVANADSRQLPGSATSIAVSVLENDLDPEGEPLQVVAVTNGTYGVATIDGGNVVYTRTKANFAEDAFTYTVANKAGFEATAIVRIVSGNNQLPVSGADQFTVTSTSPVALNVLSNDTDADGDLLKVTSVSAASRGTTSIDAGTVYYQAFDTAPGTDTFTYTVSDGQGGVATATVTIHIGVEIVAGVRDAVPGAGEEGSGVPGGATFRSFGIPSINNAESVAFAATYRAGGKIYRGIFAGNPLQPIAQEGESAPDQTGARVDTGQFLSFKDPLLNWNGDVVFLADIRSPSGVKRSGLWFQPCDGALREIVLEKVRSPNTLGVRIEKILSVALLDSGAVYIRATSKDPNTGERFASLWRYHDGSMEFPLRQGSRFEAIAGKVVRDFVVLPPIAGSPGHGRITETGIPVRVTWNDGTTATLLVDGETPQVIAESGGVASDGGTFARLGFPAINNSGDAAFLARIKNQDGSMGTKVYADSPDLGLEAMMGTGDPAPLTDGTFVKFEDPVINAQKSVAFIATIETGARRSKSRGIWCTGPARPWLALAARESSYLAGASGEGDEWLVTSLISLAMPDGAAGPIFTARVKGMNGRVETGLWACESTGEVREIIRTGQSIALGSSTKLLRSFDALKLVPRSPSQPRSYNDRGRIVYRATFADGEQAILTTVLP